MSLVSQSDQCSCMWRLCNPFAAAVTTQHKPATQDRFLLGGVVRDLLRGQGPHFLTPLKGSLVAVSWKKLFGWEEILVACPIKERSPEGLTNYIYFNLAKGPRGNLE